MAERDTEVADVEGRRAASGKVSVVALTALGIGSMIEAGSSACRSRWQELQRLDHSS